MGKYLSLMHDAKLISDPVSHWKYSQMQHNLYADFKVSQSRA